jgi:uncharacterized protein (DUF1778 family)
VPPRSLAWRARRDQDYPVQADPSGGCGGKTTLAIYGHFLLGAPRDLCRRRSPRRPRPSAATVKRRFMTRTGHTPAPSVQWPDRRGIVTRPYVYDTYMTDMLTGRLNFRLTDDQERALRQAAALTGQTVTGFVLSTAVEHAHELLDRANHIELSAADFKRFVTEIDKPAEAVPELAKLFKRKSQIPSA